MADFKYFPQIPVIGAGSSESQDPLCFRFFRKGELLSLPEKLRDRARLWTDLRRAMCIWHLNGGSSADPFGPASHVRPWSTIADPYEQCRVRVEAAFSLYERMKFAYEYHCFHDFDLVAEGDTWSESEKRLTFATEQVLAAQERTGIKCLWGTSNLFSHVRYANGAVVAADPDVFFYALRQCKRALLMTHQLGGLAFTFWGGRNGYTDLLTYLIKHSEQQAVRFFQEMIAYAGEIGFKGVFLIEPKAKEPMVHQNDHDVEGVLAFLIQYDLLKWFWINYEPNHGQLAGHPDGHDPLLAAANGKLGSVDVNQGEVSVGWDTDDYLSNPILAFWIAHATFSTGGLLGGYNVDAKPRRCSWDIQSWVAGHIMTADVMTVGFRALAYLLRRGSWQKHRDALYGGWQKDTPAGRFLNGKIAADQVPVPESVAMPNMSSGIEEMRALLFQAIVVAGNDPGEIEIAA